LQPVVFINGAAAISTVNFAPFKMIVVVSDFRNTPSGGLTPAENTALGGRRADIAAFVNSGGGLLGFMSDFTGNEGGPYPYLGDIGAFSVATVPQYPNITPTPDGMAVGITDALDVCCWHQVYNSFPTFLTVLAFRAGTSQPAAIGGAQVFVDTTPPMITCPPDVTAPNDPGQCSARVDPGMARVTDNCDTNPMVTAQRSDGRPLSDPYPVGATTITWTATDRAGNRASCTQTVTVRDTEPPRVTCPPDRTVSQDSAFGATVTYPPPTASDNCPGVTASCAPPSGSVFPLGTTTVTCTATDASGNRTSCSFRVTVVPPPSTSGARVIGGGSIPLSGGRGTFGLTASADREGDPGGNVTYQDHVTGRTVHSTQITAVVVTGTHARIFGKATVEGAGSFDFVVDVDDLGEPGTNDTFRIQMSDGYTAGGRLDGGNIQIHR
jgi:hypothetical protein